ncbi:MAG: hypothetical protein AAFR88_04030 [Pseudomonadota bacterium]
MESSFLMPASLGAALASVGAAIQWWAAKDKAAQAGHFALGIILALYVGARLASGPLSEAIMESAFASVVLLLSLFALRYWPRGVGVLIIAHGLYDQVFAHSAGLPDWYPPFCLGVDVVLGAAVVAMAPARAREAY